MVEEKKRLGVVAVAKLVGVHRNTVTNWRKKGEMPEGKKSGKITKWNADKIMKWAKETGLI